MILLRSKVFLFGIVISVLLCSSLVVSVHAASTWGWIYGGEYDDWAYSLVATPDGGYAMGGSKNWGQGCYDFWLVKTNETGEWEWDKTYGETGRSYEYAYAMVATPDGGYALAGSDFMLVKTDAQGEMQWSRTYGGGDAYALVVTFDGGYALAGGGSLVKTDALGNVQWSKAYGGSIRSLIVTSDGGYALAGSKYVANGGVACNFWLAKTNSSGVVEWEKTYGDHADSPTTMITEAAFALVTAPDGGYAMVGYKEIMHNVIPLGETDPVEQVAGSEEEYPPEGDIFPEDIWFVKTDALGNMQWNQTYGGAGIDTAHSLIVTSDGGYALAGFSDSFGPGGALLIKTDSLGNIQWQRTYGDISYSDAHALLAAPDGGYVLACDSVPVGGTGYTNFLLLKTNENGFVPEYSSLLIPALVLTATAFILINKKKILRKHSLQP